MCIGNNNTQSTLCDITITHVTSQSQIQMVDMEITFLLIGQTPDEIADRSKPLVEVTFKIYLLKSFSLVSDNYNYSSHIYIYL